MTTIPDCDPYNLQQVYEVSVLGYLCLEPAEIQNEVIVPMPTVGQWFASNWYVIFIVVLCFVLGLVGCVFQSFRWYRRIKHRHEREHRDKRVDHMLRAVSSLYRTRSDRNFAQQRLSTTSAAGSISKKSGGVASATRDRTSSYDSASSSSTSFSSSSSSSSPMSSPTSSAAEGSGADHRFGAEHPAAPDAVAEAVVVHRKSPV